MDAYAKRPADVVDVTFDMRAFAQSVDPTPVTYLLKIEEGINYVDQSTVQGVIELSISGGIAGRVYVFGVEASTADGQSRVDMRRVRLIDPSEWPTLPPGVPIGPGAGQSVYADGYADNYA